MNNSNSDKFLSQWTALIVFVMAKLFCWKFVMLYVMY